MSVEQGCKDLPGAHLNSQGFRHLDGARGWVQLHFSQILIPINSPNVFNKMLEEKFILFI
jgi:hypothetical protein